MIEIIEIIDELGKKEQARITIDESVKQYMSLPYTTMTIPEDDGSIFIKIKELPGCMSVGKDISDAYEMIKEAMEGWLEAAMISGYEILLPDGVSPGDKNKDTYVYQLVYTDSPRTGWAVLSVHSTISGAYKALNESKLETYNSQGIIHEDEDWIVKRVKLED